MAETPKADKPFAPPSPRSLAENLKPDDCEASDVAEKIRREKLGPPVGYRVNHEMVGEWRKDQAVSVKDVRDHLADKYRRVTDVKEQDAAIERLVSLNALVPIFE